MKNYDTIISGISLSLQRGMRFDRSLREPVFSFVVARK